MDWGWLLKLTFNVPAITVEELLGSESISGSQVAHGGGHDLGGGMERDPFIPLRAPGQRPRSPHRVVVTRVVCEEPLGIAGAVWDRDDVIVFV